MGTCKCVFSPTASARYPANSWSFPSCILLSHAPPWANSGDAHRSRYLGRYSRNGNYRYISYDSLLIFSKWTWGNWDIASNLWNALENYPNMDLCARGADTPDKILCCTSDIGSCLLSCWRQCGSLRWDRVSDWDCWLFASIADSSYIYPWRHPVIFWKWPPTDLT